MDKLVRGLISSAIPSNESVKRSDFQGAVANLQEKIIDKFRYCSIQFIPSFLSEMLSMITDNSNSQDKKARFSTAICITALINLFPNDENVSSYLPIIENLLVPGYRPIIEIGALVLNRFARISGPNRDRYLSHLVEEGCKIADETVGIEVKFKSAVVWKELAHSFPEGFYNMKNSFFNIFFMGIRNVRNEKSIYYLLIDTITELFQSESASVGVSFLEDFHESLIRTIIDIISAENFEMTTVIYDLLQFILNIPPFIDHSHVNLIYSKCMEGTKSKRVEIIVFSINIILMLIDKKFIEYSEQLMNELFDTLMMQVRNDWKIIEPVLAKLIIFFSNGDDSLSRIKIIYSILPKQEAAFYAFDLTYSVLQMGKVTNIDNYLRAILKYMKESKAATHIHFLLKVLNSSYKNWFHDYSDFKNSITYEIRQELSKNSAPNGPTDRLIIALSALQQIPSFSYINAIELKNLIIKLVFNKDIEVRELITSSIVYLFKDFPDQIPLDTISDLVRFTLDEQVVRVRKKSLKAFSEITYQYLEQQDIFDEFCKFSYDESPEIRKEALNIIKNLKTFDLSIMRHQLISSINLINSNFDIIIPEVTPVWIVLPNLIIASKPIIHIYADSFFDILYNMLKSRFSANKLHETSLILMNSAIFKEIDEALIKSVTKLYLLCPEIIPIVPILEVFCSILRQPVHPWTKENVLKSLKNIAEITAITDKCPDVFNALNTVIQNKDSTKLVIKALKVLGVVGVADIPMKLDKERLFLHSALSNVLYFNQYVLRIYFKYLNDCFDSNNLDSTREKIVLTVVKAYYADPSGIQDNLEPFLSKYLDFITNSTSERIPEFLKYLEGIIYSAGYLIIPYTDRIYKSLEELWNNKYTKQASKVFTQLVVSTEGKCESILQLLVSSSFLLIRYKKELMESAEEIFKLLRAISQYCPDHLQSIIDGSVKIMSMSGSPAYLQQQSLDTIEFIIRNSNFQPFLSMIIRCLNALSMRSQMIWREQANKLLSYVNSIQNQNMDIHVILSQRVVTKKNNRFLNNPFYNTMANDEFDIDFDLLIDYFTFEKANENYQRNLPGNQSKVLRERNQRERKRTVYQWFDDLCVFLIQNCNSDIILSMLSLPSLPYFAFKFAFYAIWPHFNQPQKTRIVEKLNDIFIKSNFPPIIMSQFISIVEFSILSEIDLGVNLCSVINSCISSRLYAKALFFLENYPDPEFLQDYTKKLINMNIALYRNNEAICLANDENNKDKIDISVWMALNDWEIALSLINKTQIESANNNNNDNANTNNANSELDTENDNDNDNNNNTVYSSNDNNAVDTNDAQNLDLMLLKDKELMIQKVQCLASMENWKEIKEMKPILLEQNKKIQSKLARFMWMAELFQGNKDEALECVNLTGAYTVADLIDKAILYIHLDLLIDARNCFHLAWRYLASSICHIEKHNKQQMILHIFQAEQLHELSEVIAVKRDPSLAPKIFQSWRARIKFIKEDTEKQKELFKIRSLVGDMIDPTEFAFNILKSTKWTSKGIEKLIDLFFPDQNSFNAKYCRVKLIEDKYERIKQAKILLKSIPLKKQNENIIKRLNNFLGKENFEVATSFLDLENVVRYLEEGQKNQILLAQVQILRSLLLNDENIAVSAIKDNLKNCLDSNIAINLHQLESMTIHFPNSEKVFNNVISIFKSNAIKAYNFKYIEKTCVLSMCNTNEYVQNAAKEVCHILATQIPESIIYDLHANNLRFPKCKLYTDLMNILQSSNPLFHSQMTRIINKLEQISHTLYDKLIEQLKLCFEDMKRKDYISAFKNLKKISKTLGQVNVARYDNEFMERFKKRSGVILNQLLEKGSLEESDSPIIQKLIASTIKKQDAVRVIPLSSLDTELGSKKNWSVPIFGKINSNDQKIVSFFHSVQRLDNGLRIAVFGSNGKKYSFHLLRGERYHVSQSEQFMTLLNALSPISFTQRSMIEINPNLTLTEFLKGRIQLFDLVNMYQQSKGRNPDEDFIKVQESYSKCSKKEWYKKIDKEIGVNDEDDLKKVLLITSQNATMYINKTSMFAKTIGTLSAVSYIIGGADISPRGILIDKTSGEVAYANFRVTGMSQNVPFRLTRMIVSALGPYGVKGPFIVSLIKTLKGIRKYYNALSSCVQFALGNAPFDPHQLPEHYLGRYSAVRAPMKEIPADSISASSSIDYPLDSDDESILSPLVSRQGISSTSTSNTNASSSSSRFSLKYSVNQDLYSEEENVESKNAVNKFYKRIAGNGNPIELEVENLIKKAQSMERLSQMPLNFYAWW